MISSLNRSASSATSSVTPPTKCQNGHAQYDQNDRNSAVNHDRLRLVNHPLRSVEIAALLIIGQAPTLPKKDSGHSCGDQQKYSYESP